VIDELVADTKKIVKALHIVGLVNVQYAWDGEKIYVIEVNPRASRTVPILSKVTKVPMVKIAVAVMTGKKLKDMEWSTGLYKKMDFYAIKVPVFSDAKLTDVDVAVGPEMKSTGEVMGVGCDMPSAYAKTILDVDYKIPTEGCVFISVCDSEKRSIIPVATAFDMLGFDIVATRGTAKALRSAGLEVSEVNKISEGGPTINDLIAEGNVDLIVNIPFGQQTRGDGFALRSTAVRHGISYITTLAAASASILALRSAQKNEMDVHALQDFAQWDIMDNQDGIR
jgi:carbamoyl-phosphate synthase large subunit